MVRKIILYMLGAILVFFGVFGFILSFFNLSGTPVGMNVRIAYAVIAVVGIAIIVVNRLIKARKPAEKTPDEKPLKLGFREKKFYNRLLEGCCPHCGKKMTASFLTESGEENYQCPSNCMTYKVRRNGFYTTETDENGKRKLVAHDLYTYVYLYRRYFDGDCGMVGNIGGYDCELILNAFEFASAQPKTEYGEDTPEFKQAERDGRAYDGDFCPICCSSIKERKKFVKGSAQSPGVEYEPAFIPSLGGAVFIRHEKSGYDHYMDVIDCGKSCYTDSANLERIARAMPFHTKESYKADLVLKTRFKVKGSSFPRISYPDK